MTQLITHYKRRGTRKTLSLQSRAQINYSALKYPSVLAIKEELEYSRIQLGLLAFSLAVLR